jgi:hypothetical protein
MLKGQTHKSMLIPGQNMSCFVFETVRWVTLPVAGSQIEVCVYPVPPKDWALYDDHVRTFPEVGSKLIATGTIGKSIVRPHCPWLALFEL